MPSSAAGSYRAQFRMCSSDRKRFIVLHAYGSRCIHHSDQGVQYASWEYVQRLKKHHLQISMARRGNPYDNAFAESFMKTLKSEEIDLWEYRTLEDVYQRLPFFIENVYNKKRLHSSLDYLPPDEFEAMVIQTNNLLHPCPSL